MRENRVNGFSASKLVMHLFMIIYMAACILPLLLTVSVSFMTDSEISRYGYMLIPKHINWDSYRVIFKFPQVIYKGYYVSIFVTAIGTVLSILICSLIAYPLSRSDFKYKNVLSFYVFFTMLFSGGLVSQYILMTQYLGLSNSLWALILPILTVPMNIFLLRVFMQDIPPSLIEASKIEGASEYIIFFKIIAPLAKPGIAAVCLFISLMYWNDAFLSMLFIKSADKKPLQLILNELATYVMLLKSQALQAEMAGASTFDIPSDGVMFAMSVIASGPMLFVFAYFQKYFVKGLVIGAVKS